MRRMISTLHLIQWSKGSPSIASWSETGRLYLLFEMTSASSLPLLILLLDSAVTSQSTQGALSRALWEEYPVLYS